MGTALDEWLRARPGPCLFDRVSLGSLNPPGTYHVGQRPRTHRDPPASASRVLELKGHTLCPAHLFLLSIVPFGFPNN